MVFFVLIVNTKKNAIVDKSLSNQMHVHGVLKHIDERKAKHDENSNMYHSWNIMNISNALPHTEYRNIILQYIS
jgi:hypothetical protein